MRSERGGAFSKALPAHCRQQVGGGPGRIRERGAKLAQGGQNIVRAIIEKTEDKRIGMNGIDDERGQR